MKKIDPERLKDYTIESIMSRYGSEAVSKDSYHCILPGHKDTNASLKIYPRTNTWFCFGCQRGGDAIALIQYIENCTFPEAVELLSGETIETHHRRESLPPPPPPMPTEKDLQIYEAFLSVGKLSAAGLAYMRARGFSELTLHRYGVKSIDEPQKAGDWLKQRFTEDELSAAGLFRNGRFVFYEPCLIIPHYQKGRGVYLQSRNLAGNVKSFKLARPQLPYKGTGFDTADKVIVTEGAIDALSYFQLFGNDNFISFSGIPKAEAIAELLRDGKKLMLCLDNDEAGRSGTQKITSFIKEKIEVINWADMISRYQLPEGTKDFNDILKFRGAIK